MARKDFLRINRYSRPGTLRKEVRGIEVHWIAAPGRKANDVRRWWTPALGAMLDDVPRVIRGLDLAPNELVLFGRSVGSIYAIHATLHFPDVAGLIIELGQIRVAADLHV